LANAEPASPGCATISPLAPGTNAGHLLRGAVDFATASSSRAVDDLGGYRHRQDRSRRHRHDAMRNATTPCDRTIVERRGP
jgi:hypothetical protein